MKAIELIEVQPGEWDQPKAEADTYWRMWRRDWRLLLAVHVPAFTLMLLIDQWLR